MAENNDFNVLIGGIIKGAREKRGLNQSELAKKSEIDKGLISRYECGMTCPSVRSLFLIMKALGYIVVFRPIEAEGRKYYKEIKRNV